jgi:ParB-like chromosome segregation protein Spo0J
MQTNDQKHRLPDGRVMPLERLQWIHRDTLQPNNYNPNSVAPPELELLKTSIKEDGWTQPIVANPDMTIVDGFHRWTVSGHKEVFELTGGFVPVVILEPKDREHQQMSTIRHNRARGRHGVLQMGSIVKDLIDGGKTVEEVMKRLKMEREEVQRLLNTQGVMAHPDLDKPYSKAWEPEQ